jgi:hypothetical protein
MTHAIVMYSGGIGSWAAGLRTAERYGRENTTLLFCDTKQEDEDLYRFLHEGATVIGVPVITIADGRTPWEVFHDERYLGNNKIAPCSRILKQEVAEAWIRERYGPGDCVRFYGMDWCQREQMRLDAIAARCAPYAVDAPLFWPPVLDKDMAKLLAMQHGLRLPRLYGDGFAHNNCGGACVRAGQAHWATLYRTHPERYALYAAKEEELRAVLDKDVSILRDRQRGKPTKPLTLTVFAARLAHSPELPFGTEPEESCACFT